MSAVEYTIFIILLTVSLIIGWYKYTSYCAGLEREVKHLKKKLGEIPQCQHCRSKSSQRSRGITSKDVVIPRVPRWINEDVQAAGRNGQEHQPVGPAISHEEAFAMMVSNNLLSLSRNQIDILQKLQQVTSQLAKGENSSQ